MKIVNELEILRQALQTELDKLKTQEERNILGQFATPITLANDILTHAKRLMPKRSKVRFLDPAFGTGSFYSALHNIFEATRIEFSTGYEIDEHYGKPAYKLWSNSKLNYQIADFTKQKAPNEDEKYNLIICNPPYVRHHHINAQKERLQAQAFKVANMKLSKLAGLYCYFMALSHAWIKKNGISGWLIPSEFMDVNYGKAIKDYLLNEVTLLQLHRFDPNDVQFDDALLWYESLFPASWAKTRFLLADYQWLSLVGLLVFGLVLDQCVRLILALIAQICVRVFSDYRGAEIGPHVFRPVGLLSQGFLWCYGTMLLGLPDSVLSVVLGLLKILTIIAGVRTMHLLIDALRRYALQRAAKTPTLHDDLLVLLTCRALKLLIICVGVLVAARAFDLPVVGILGGMGLGGIAIALASKDAISNLIGSFSVLVDRPFRVGDWVVINGIEGNIESIGFRSTRVRTFAHSLVTIPNSTMITTEIDNMGARRYRRIKTIIRIHYGTKPAVIDAFCEGVRELIKRHPYTRKDEYHIYLSEFGEHTIHVMLYCFIECEDWSIELREQHRFLGDVMRLAEELGIQVGGRYHYAADPSADISQSEDPYRVGQEKAAHIAGPLLDVQRRVGDVEFGGPTDVESQNEDPPPPEGEGRA